MNTNDFGVFSIIVGEGVGEETYSLLPVYSQSIRNISHEHTIGISELRPGIYILKAIVGGQVYIRRFTVE